MQLSNFEILHIRDVKDNRHPDRELLRHVLCWPLRLYRYPNKMQDSIVSFNFRIPLLSSFSGIPSRSLYLVFFVLCGEYLMPFV